jgi:hypothetical protein
LILLLYNGVIYTLNPEQPHAQAVAIRDGRILAVGSMGKVRAATAGARVEGIDLRGRAVIPGLTDAHTHATWYGMTQRQVQLADTHSLDEALARIADKARTLAPGAWLLGGGWNHTAWQAGWPTRAHLDSVCPDNPAALMRRDGHSIWANSRALRLAGIDADTPDPPGGHIQRAQAGEPTGIVLETAQDIVQRAFGRPAPAERLDALRDVLAEALSYGLTGLHIPPSPDADDARETLTDLHTLYARGELSVRCMAHLAARDLDAAIALGLRSGLGDAWLRVGGLKIFADGTLGSETADMLKPYEGRRDTGMATMPADELETLVQRAYGAGLCVAVHAIGDAANRKVLTAIEKARAADASAVVGEPRHPDPPALPNRIEHAQLVHPDDIARFHELGVIASVQPLHATCDMHKVDELWGSRGEHAYAFRSLQEAGATLACGSDAPVEDFNPWQGIHAAVTRQRPDGTPPEGWYPAQRLGLRDALRAYCIGPAIASAEAHQKGMLAPGMRADMAVLAVDPFALAAEQLHTVSVDITLVDGMVRWERT